jgi:hypothetical protein
MDGYTCKQCSNDYNRAAAKERYYSNHEEELQKRREYRELNRDKINQRKREIYAMKHPSKPLLDAVFIRLNDKLDSTIRTNISELTPDELEVNEMATFNS